MPRPRNDLAGSTEWLLCRREVQKIFERYKAPADFFEKYGPLVFGAVTCGELQEPGKLAIAELITSNRRNFPRVLRDVRLLWEHKQRTDIFLAARWIANRWRFIRFEQPDAKWPWDAKETAKYIRRDTGCRSISHHTVKDARELLKSCRAPSVKEV
jgi:hypothetical protein